MILLLCKYSIFSILSYFIRITSSADFFVFMDCDDPSGEQNFNEIGVKGWG